MSTPPPPPPGFGNEPTAPAPAAPPPPPSYSAPPAAPPPAYGYAPSAPGAAGPVNASKKVPAGICGILLGSLGIHKFILGYKKEGLIMLLTTIFTLGIAGIVWGIIGLIEGIIYLTKSDQDFYDTYVVGHKGWF
jgi:TM2 domain-containing membrane protein YozV